ncbi:hypothetical protein O6H91_02G076100 [Diphasiastrum complanatum]|uniref:Uncharacterized protein n=1 Tax=Diphasiastrum complanatum TaxID=34168 RepID=A0ACC2EHC3_DIPCM|nr:hypothetical protein O6H91_02G076100 [Diphasiastrum complanatum]
MPKAVKRSSVLAWGAGEDGQLGLGNLEDKDWVCRVDDLEGLSVVSVVAGSRNSLAICEDGRLYTWGWNQRGTLGHPPETKTESTPSQVKALENVKIVQAAIGGWHCLAVDEEGRTYAWGGNEYGQCAEEPEKKGEGKILHRDITIPRRCCHHLHVRQVAAGGTHSVVLTEEGRVWTWGQPWPPGDIIMINGSKQISTPVRVQGLEKVRVVAAGAFHNLALLEPGNVWAWGNNEYGQLGTGDTQPRASPIPVRGLTGLVLEDIAAGGWHSMALTVDGQVYAWGRGEHGRLGFGDDKSSKMFPQRVHLLTGDIIVQVVRSYFEQRLLLNLIVS